MPPPRCHRLPLTVLCALALLIGSHDAQASWRQGWGLAPAPVPAAGIALPPYQLRLPVRGEKVQVRVVHNGHGPVQVRVRDRTQALPGFPLVAVLERPGNHQLAQLPVGPGYHLLLDVVPGLPGPPPPAVAYRLPFAQAPVRVHQGARGLASHRDRENRHAWDFALPEGTPVLAARAGTVMALANASAGPVARPGDGGNWIRVLHADGSMAVYAHLQQDSVIVQPGQAVAAGQQIARSGNTGHSSAPHLHFVVQHNAGLQLASLPVDIHAAQGRLLAAGSTGGTPL